jgi:hypothetical protein
VWPEMYTVDFEKVKNSPQIKSPECFFNKINHIYLLKIFKTRYINIALICTYM